MRLTSEIRAAMRRYYKNCARQGVDGYKWDKAADIEHLGDCLEKTGRVNYCEATAGTFMISWKDGVQTIHNRKNYWREVVCARKRGLQWVQYRDCCGEKLKTPEVLA